MAYPKGQILPLTLLGAGFNGREKPRDRRGIVALSQSMGSIAIAVISPYRGWASAGAGWTATASKDKPRSRQGSERNDHGVLQTSELSG